MGSSWRLWASYAVCIIVWPARWFITPTYHPPLVLQLELDKVVCSQRWSFRWLSLGCSIKPCTNQEACSGPLLRHWRIWTLQTTLDYCPTSSNTYKRSHSAWASCITNMTRNKHPETKELEGQHSHPNGGIAHRRCWGLHLLRKHYQQDRRHEEDIKSRIGKARHVFVTMKPVWNQLNIFNVLFRHLDGCVDPRALWFLGVYF